MALRLASKSAWASVTGVTQLASIAKSNAASVHSIPKYVASRLVTGFQIEDHAQVVVCGPIEVGQERRRRLLERNVSRQWLGPRRGLTRSGSSNGRIAPRNRATTSISSPAMGVLRPSKALRMTGGTRTRAGIAPSKIETRAGADPCSPASFHRGR